MEDWHLEQIYAQIHALQPEALVGNNHHVTPLAGEDFQIYEGAFPEEVQYGGKIVARAGMPAEIYTELGPTGSTGTTDMPRSEGASHRSSPTRRRATSTCC